MRNRPHQHQISDSRYTVNDDRTVTETWWAIDRRGDKEDMEFVHGPFEGPEAVRFAEERGAR